MQFIKVHITRTIIAQLKPRSFWIGLFGVDSYYGEGSAKKGFSKIQPHRD